MKFFRTLFHKSAERVNYCCILLEGLFNSLGTDIMGMTTIVPLFLAEFGASLPLIGSLSTIHSVISAIVPLLSGAFIAATASKRRLSMTLNGFSRGLILLLPISLLFRFSNPAVVCIFFCIMIIYYICQPITGITWNHLLGDCVTASQRGKLMGTLFAISGFITFASSNIIKVIRENQALEPHTRYAIIFGLAGTLMASSVFFFLPLKEKKQQKSSKEERNLKAYLSELICCFKNRNFDKLLLTNAFSSISTMINAFLYLFAQNQLMLTTTQISNMLITQTVGVVVGGFTTGWISSRFGTKRMLIIVESIGLSIPILALISRNVSQPFLLMLAAVFFMGFSKSGYMGYQTHLLEVVAPEKRIYHIVSKSLIMLPFSLVSIFVGLYIEHFSVEPIFYIQIAIAVLAIFCASRLKLINYSKERKE